MARYRMGRLTFFYNGDLVRRRVTNGMHRGLAHAARSIRQIAMRSIRVTKKRPSNPGTPPHTRTGTRRLKRSILYNTDKRSMTAIIGPTADMIEQIGRLHEFGGVQPRKLRDWAKTLQIGGYGPLFKVRDAKVVKVRRKTRRGTYRNESRTIKPGDYFFGKIRSGKELANAWRNAAALDAIARGKPKRYPKRPFMKPAMRTAIGRMDKYFAGVISK